MAKLFDNVAASQQAMENENERKKGYFDIVTTDDEGNDVTKSFASAIGLLADDSLDILNQYDSESAKVLREDLDTLAPSGAAAIQADRDALQYYKEKVIPGMQDIEQRAIEAKSKTPFSSFTDFLVPLAAAAFMSSKEDAYAFNEAFMKGVERKAKTSQERTLLMLESEAKALERLMNVKEKEASILHKAYAYGKETLEVISKKAQQARQEFQLSQMPVVESVATQLGQQLAISMTNPSGGNVDLSKPTVMNLIKETAKKFTISLDNLTEDQQKVLYQTVISASHAHQQTFFKSILDAQSKEGDREVDYMAYAAWGSMPLMTSALSKPHEDALKDINKALLDPRDAVIRQEFQKKGNTIVNQLDDFNNKHFILIKNYMPPNDAEAFTLESYNKLLDDFSSKDDTREHDQPDGVKRTERQQAIYEYSENLLKTGPLKYLYIDTLGYQRVIPKQVTTLTKTINNSLSIRKNINASIKEFVGTHANKAITTFDAVASSYLTSVTKVLNSLNPDVSVSINDEFTKELALTITMEGVKNNYSYLDIVDALARSLDNAVLNTEDINKIKTDYTKTNDGVYKQELIQRAKSILTANPNPTALQLEFRNNLNVTTTKGGAAREIASKSGLLHNAIKEPLAALNNIRMQEMSSNGLLNTFEALFTRTFGEQLKANPALLNTLMNEILPRNTYINRVYLMTIH